MVSPNLTYWKSRGGPTGVEKFRGVTTGEDVLSPNLQSSDDLTTANSVPLNRFGKDHRRDHRPYSIPTPGRRLTGTGGVSTPRGAGPSRTQDSFGRTGLTSVDLHQKFHSDSGTGSVRTRGPTLSKKRNEIFSSLSLRSYLNGNFILRFTDGLRLPNFAGHQTGTLQGNHQSLPETRGSGRHCHLYDRDRSN